MGEPMYGRRRKNYIHQKLYNLQHLSEDVEATFTWNRGRGNMNCPKRFVPARHVQFTVPNLLWASLGRICWNRFPRKRYRHDRSPRQAFGRKICNEGSEIQVLIFFDLRKNHIGTESPNSTEIPGMGNSMPWCSQIANLGSMRWVGNATSSTRPP